MGAQTPQICESSTSLAHEQPQRLQPLTMNEAKCDSVQELISKLNYDLSDTDIPFLILYNKADVIEHNLMAINEHRITSMLRLDQIIDQRRMFNCFACTAIDSEGTEVLEAFN